MNNLKILFIFSMFCILSGLVKSQSNFYGTITYECFKIGTKEEYPPTEIIISIGEKFIRIENNINLEFIGTQSTAHIINLEDKSTISLFNDTFGKYAIKYSKEEMDSLKKTAKNQGQQEQKIIIYTDITKKILGYNCKKAELQMPNDTNKLDLYFTTEIKVPKEINEYFGFSEIDGVFLQCSHCFSGIGKFSEECIVTKIAKKIKKGKPDMNLFIIPDDYEILESFDELLIKQSNRVF